MRYVKDIRAEDVVPGDFLEDENKFVIEVSHIGTRVMLRCAPEMGPYPSMSLILDHDQMVSVTTVEDWA